MEPLSIATSFATIISLISNFRSERAGKDLKDFIEWLAEKKCENVIKLINNNGELSNQLITILEMNHQSILNKLEELDLQIASIASQMEGFSGLAISLHQESLLSEQAINIIRQLIASGAPMFIEKKSSRGENDAYILMSKGAGDIQYDDPQFIEDDLRTLHTFGLLRIDESHKNRRFSITRLASKIVNNIDS